MTQLSQPIFVYVIKSIREKYRYVGITKNISKRLTAHNEKKNQSTQFYAPFEIIYQEHYTTCAEARAREKFLKSGFGRKFLDELEIAKND